MVNGTFDCVEASPAGTGWLYAAPKDEGSNGYAAVITTGQDRSSNFLKVTPVAVEVTSTDPLLPEKILWQDGIVLGEDPIEQLVLRFDHLITQTVADKGAIKVTLTVQGETTSGNSATYEDSIRLDSLPSNALQECNVETVSASWLTSELYLDFPDTDLIPSTRRASISFEGHALDIPENLNDPQCTENIRCYASFLLDNVELRTSSACRTGNHPEYCLLETLCGGAGINSNASAATMKVTSVAGNSTQDCRRFAYRCLISTTCCDDSGPPGGGFGVPSRITATMGCDVDYQASQSRSLANPSANYSADLNGDRIVDGTDLTILLGSWGQTGCLLADINADGLVNGADITILLGSWGTCDCPC